MGALRGWHYMPDHRRDRWAQNLSNLTAFLDMVSHSEGTDRATNPYAVCFGYKHTIVDFSDHPSENTIDHPVEWPGESISFLGPDYVGMISTAAGKYQITLHTWRALAAALNLPDFSPQSQDAGATLLIKQKGALDLVNSGQVAAAIAKCASIWASLPGSTAGQPTRLLGALVTSYTDHGGAFA